MSADLYFIALVAPESLRECVHALKLEIQQRFGAGHALRSPAHITLQMPFRLQSEFREELVEVLRQLAGMQYPFTVELEGIECFAPRVIFIRIKDHGPVLTLEKKLKAVLLKQQILSKVATSFPFHPHMTIATRDLEEQAFIKAWVEFKDRSFHRDFEVSSLFLLRYNGSYWDFFKEFEFGSLDPNG